MQRIVSTAEGRGATAAGLRIGNGMTRMALHRGVGGGVHWHTLSKVDSRQHCMQTVELTDTYPVFCCRRVA